jgi:hypothetical protein
MSTHHHEHHAEEIVNLARPKCHANGCGSKLMHLHSQKAVEIYNREVTNYKCKAMAASIHGNAGFKDMHDLDQKAIDHAKNQVKHGIDKIHHEEMFNG